MNRRTFVKAFSAAALLPGLESPLAALARDEEIGRASCRERV